jgi:DNA primase
MEGLDFKESLELLARKAGVDLEQYRRNPGTNGPDKTRLHQLLDLSTKFYQLQFSKYQPAWQYVFGERKFTKATALLWRLGYAPNNGTSLIQFLQAKGFSDAEMKQAGVSVQRYQGNGDMFRDRLMIPLQDPFGAVIGFTARILNVDPKVPKYINTPQTVLYDKSRHVFGLHLAKEAIRKNHYAVVAEGNLDVIASHQVDVQQVVATAGTALTEHHLKSIGRLANDIRLSFDTDSAGLAATERAIPIAGQVGVSLSIIDIPNGKDPDELIRHSPTAWQTAIDEHTYALDWLMGRYQHLLDITSAQGKRQFTDVLLPLVQRLTDSVEQDHYMNVIASVVNVSREALSSKLATIPAAKTIRKRQSVTLEPLDPQSIEYHKLQDHLLAIMLMQPSLRAQLALMTSDMMLKPEAKQLLTFLKANPDFNGPVNRQLQEVDDYVKILGLEYEELYQDVEPAEMELEMARLLSRLVEAYVKHQKQKLSASLETATEVQTASLLEQVKQLDALLKSVTGGL